MSSSKRLQRLVWAQVTIGFFAATVLIFVSLKIKPLIETKRDLEVEVRTHKEQVKLLKRDAESILYFLA